MKNQGDHNNKKQRIALCLILQLVFSALIIYGGILWKNKERPKETVSIGGEKKTEETVSDGEKVLENPRIVIDGNMESGQKVTWDCVYFGSYPQAEVITTAMRESYGETLGEEQIQKGDLLIDDTVYAALQSAVSWDEKGDITLEDGTKYRRIKREDATNVVNGKSYYYNWTDRGTYHYFIYQPIKWRVLSTDGSKALLLSDKVLDGKQYDPSGGDTTWETSFIRRWLNAYESSYMQGDGKYFIDCAFTGKEQEAILDTSVVNDDNLGAGTDGDGEGGNDTTDKLFLLSETEAYFDTELAGAYGFDSRVLVEDEARQAKSSTYAKAMGLRTQFGGNSKWWLRSPGEISDYAINAWETGTIWHLGEGVGAEDNGVRPAFYLDLNASSAFYSYAGTRCSEEARYRHIDSSASEAMYVRGINQKNVTIPDTITIEGENCAVTSAAKEAFDYCHKVKSVTVGSNITIIPKEFFYGMEKLKEIIIKSENLKEVGKNAIKWIAKDAVIKVPQGKAEEYKKLFTAKAGYKETMKIVEYDKAAYEEEQEAAADKAEENQGATGSSLANPRKEKDVSMKAGNKVTWDCVWFGSYPQAEVITTAMEKNYTVIGSAYLREGDLVIDDAVYAALQEATGWDSNGDITLDGEKYRRLEQKNTFSFAFNGEINEWYYRSYNWEKKGSYHYFKYEPVKWRVLSTDGDKALLLSDKILDNQKYHAKDTKVKWESSTLRSWLNGYDTSANSQGTSYRKKSFIDSAFNPDEQGAIRETSVTNASAPMYHTKGGNNTIDKLFLLSTNQVENSTIEGDSKIAENNFDSREGETEALCAKSSTYAKAMGTNWCGFAGSEEGNCWWWLRSPGWDSSFATNIDPSGYREMVGWDVDGSLGIRVALYLNLDTASNLYSYAGTRCSDEVHYKVTSSLEKEAVYLGSEVAKTAIIPASVMLEGESCKVTSIAEGAFDGYGYRIYGDYEDEYEEIGIRSVTIGSNVTTIGENAFRKCKYLEEITIESENLQEIGKDAFKGIAEDALIKVPEGKAEEYKKLFTAETGYKKTMEIAEVSLQ